MKMVRLRQVGFLATGLVALLVVSPAIGGVVSIVNPGFETDTAPAVGASGWTITSGGTDFFTTTAGAPDSLVDPGAAFEGTNWLSGNRLATGAGSSSNPQTISQLINISGDADVSSGNGILSLDFQYADNDLNDIGTVTVSFFSDVAGTSSVGTALTTTLADEGGVFNDPATWTAASLTGAVPGSAQSLLLELSINRLGGSAGNVHFDDFSGTITAVPEPGSLALLGLGSLSLIARRRRKA